MNHPPSSVHAQESGQTGSQSPKTFPPSPVWIWAALLALFLQGCLLVSIRPVGKGIGVLKKDLPQVKTLDGDRVYSFLQPDRIPAIDNPQLVPGAEADFMADDELVLGIEIDGEARAYSLWHLDRHEIVNDWLGGEPIAATW